MNVAPCLTQRNKKVGKYHHLALLIMKIPKIAVFAQISHIAIVIILVKSGALIV